MKLISWEYSQAGTAFRGLTLQRRGAPTSKSETEYDPMEPSWVQKPFCVPQFLFVGKSFSFLDLS